jgi:hypothetical protein
MNRTRFWVAAGIIACIIVIGFALSVPHTHDVAQTAASQNKTAIVPPVTLHDSFTKGVHTITGSLAATDACAIVTANAEVSGSASSTERILVSISMPADVGVCLQLPTSMNFSATISAPAHLPISATVNGSGTTATIL